jgi:hypothetical protein
VTSKDTRRARPSRPGDYNVARVAIAVRSLFRSTQCKGTRGDRRLPKDCPLLPHPLPSSPMAEVDSPLLPDGLTQVISIQIGASDPPGTTYIPGLRIARGPYGVRSPADHLLGDSPP